MRLAMFGEGSGSWPFLPLSTAVPIAGFICAVALHRYVMVGAYVILCAYALIGPKQAIKALSLNYLILFFNPALQEPPVAAATLRWVVLFVAGLRVLPAIPVRSLRLVVPLLIFSAMVVALSVVNSPSLEISCLKITVFTYCAATVLVAFSLLDRIDLGELRTWFLTVSTVVVLLSLPTLAVSKVGFFRNGTGFQGIFLHPQALGIFLAPAAAYMGACLLLTSRAPSPYAWTLWGMVMMVMLLTRARTAVLAFSLSLATALTAALFSSKRARLNLAPARALIAVAAVSTVLAVGMFVSPSVSNTMEGFWLKGTKKGDIGQAFYHSRGMGIAFSWRRFLQNKMIGQGFGIDASGVGHESPETILGIPVSASTESGFLPAAFLSQVGILGMAFFVPFFLSLLKETLARVDIGLVAMFFACLFVNVGEAVFFSPGQTGGYLWLLLGLAAASGWEIQSFHLRGAETADPIHCSPFTSR